MPRHPERSYHTPSCNACPAPAVGIIFSLTFRDEATIPAMSEAAHGLDGIPSHLQLQSPGYSD
jgi:hypothetical protein